MSHTRKLDAWQRERNELDRRSLITREARERMRRQSAREQLASLRRGPDCHADPDDDADDSSLRNWMR